MRLTRRHALLSLAAFPAFPAHAAEADPFTTLLDRYGRMGRDGLVRVDYAGFAASSADRRALADVIAAYAGTKVSGLARPAQFALWSNLYNALTLQVVLDEYPIGSIRSIRSRGTGLDPKSLIGPWRTKLVTVEGRRLSLDDIEHAILRPTFKDPRVHYAVNCASVGCPNLPLRAWRADTLSADLDVAARAFLAHPRGARLTSKGEVALSSIYNWFEKDFGGEKGVRAHVAAYAPAAVRDALNAGAEIAAYDYDWALNDTKGRA